LWHRKHKGQYGQITKIDGHRERDGIEGNLRQKRLKRSAAEQAGGQDESVVVLRVGSWDHHGRLAVVRLSPVRKQTYKSHKSIRFHFETKSVGAWSPIEWHSKDQETSGNVLTRSMPEYPVTFTEPTC
jgi:hypothetical protein